MSLIFLSYSEDIKQESELEMILCYIKFMIKAEKDLGPTNKRINFLDFYFKNFFGIFWKVLRSLRNDSSSVWFGFFF